MRTLYEIDVLALIDTHSMAIEDQRRADHRPKGLNRRNRIRDAQQRTLIGLAADLRRLPDATGA